MAKTIGIDLGTTNSVVAVMEGNEPIVIPNEEGGRTTPSVVAFDNKGEVLVGRIARNQAVTNPENTIYSIKRFMGMRYDAVESERKRVPYDVVRASNGDVAINIRGKNYSPPEISAKILMKLKRAAENYLGETVTQAVITVPAYFNDSQRQATKDAGKIAGLEVKRIVNEPTAAALAYGIKETKEQRVVVYDLGGGTFDVSILELSDDVVEVISTNGDTHLGGDDFDQVLIDYLLKEFKSSTGIDVSKDKMVLQRLKEAAETAKKELSSRGETEIKLPFLTANADGPQHLDTSITRAKFESLIGHLVEKTLEPCKKALNDAKMNVGDVDEIILVGGSTRVPLVQKTVEEFFKRSPHKGVNPDEVVALGAAIQAGVMSGEVSDMLLLDVTPLSLGIETKGGVMTTLIPRNTTIPAKKQDIFSTAEDNQTSVTVHVLQGERPMARDNKPLAQFNLDGIPPAPRGVPQIEVTFDIDADGIVHVSARDKATGKEQKIRIEADSGLSDSDIERMMQEAEAHKAEDEAKRALVETKNKGEAKVHAGRKALEEAGDKFPGELKSELEAKLDKLEKAVEDGDKDEIEKSMKEVEEIQHKFAEQMYAAANAAEPGGEPAGDEKKDDDDVIDAEFEDA